MAKSVIFITFVIVLCLMIFKVQAALPEFDAEGKPCICATTDDLTYVCGTDGETYSNISELECSNKCLRKTVQVRSMGPCDSPWE
ncbi:hypothetical protein TKK_0016011 [Trichogramma kaykai]|uniref:Kazal-like domain-containing protein n=1 Tax=Trichogramma kaykai TaxID=54128 RepID=A0ABD2W8S5_9HYME